MFLFGPTSIFFCVKNLTYEQITSKTLSFTPEKLRLGQKFTENRLFRGRGNVIWVIYFRDGFNFKQKARKSIYESSDIPIILQSVIKKTYRSVPSELLL